LVPNENYARGVAYDASSGKLYAGVGAHAHLVELDPKTGAKRDILPAKYHDKKFCYAVDVIDGHIFAQLTDGGVCVVLNAKTGEEETTLPNVTGQQVFSPKSPIAGDDRVYY